MLRFGKTKVAREIDNVAISKLVETKNNSKYLIGYLDEVTRPLVLILTKLSGYVKVFKDKGKDKSKNTNLMSLRIDEAIRKI